VTLFGTQAVRLEAAANSQRPRDVELPAGASDSLLERLRAVRLPRLKTSDQHCSSDDGSSSKKQPDDQAEPTEHGD